MPRFIVTVKTGGDTYAVMVTARGKESAKWRAVETIAKRHGVTGTAMGTEKVTFDQHEAPQ